MAIHCSIHIFKPLEYVFTGRYRQDHSHMHRHHRMLPEHVHIDRFNISVTCCMKLKHWMEVY